MFELPQSFIKISHDNPWTSWPILYTLQNFPHNMSIFDQWLSINKSDTPCCLCWSFTHWHINKRIINRVSYNLLAPAGTTATHGDAHTFTSHWSTRAGENAVAVRASSMHLFPLSWLSLKCYVLWMESESEDDVMVDWLLMKGDCTYLYYANRHKVAPSRHPFEVAVPLVDLSTNYWIK